ncbi:MAG: hypothetical protein OXN81_11245 [Alphaproteobacteria bacterium]|nr:hypothetical protein [Alphaproteobacteria bacterium]
MTRESAMPMTLERRLAERRWRQPFACRHVTMRATRRRSDFPVTIMISCRDPDPFDYCIATTTVSDATAIVARMRALGRGARIEDVDA